MLSKVFVLALAGSAIAAPLAERSTGSFTVPVIYKAGTRSPRHEMRKALLKWGKELPEGLKNLPARSSSGSDGSVTAKPTSQDEEYLAQVTIGKSGTFNLDFDTGSSDLWVFSSELPASEQKGHNIYKTSEGTAKSGYTWEIEYGDGSSASGNVYTDSVSVGGVTVSNQAVEAAKKISSEFQQDPSDGLLGLAFSSINTVEPKQQNTFFKNAEASLKSPVFVADLRHQADGTYTFGEIPSAASGIKYVDVETTNGFWEFKTKSGTAIADTGTTLLLLADNSDVKSYYKNVKGAKLDNSQGGYTFPCSSASDLQDLTVPLGSEEATVSAALLNFGPIESGSSTCFGGVQYVGSGSQGIYGDVFLKSVYAIFDDGNTRFGFAPKSDS